MYIKLFGDLFTVQILKQVLKENSESALRWNLRVCIPNKIPGDAQAVGGQSTL